MMPASSIANRLGKKYRLRISTCATNADAPQITLPISSPLRIDREMMTIPAAAVLKGRSRAGCASQVIANTWGCSFIIGRWCGARSAPGGPVAYRMRPPDETPPRNRLTAAFREGAIPEPIERAASVRCATARHRKPIIEAKRG